jgi:hypothetical protein
VEKIRNWTVSVKTAVIICGVAIIPLTVFTVLAMNARDVTATLLGCSLSGAVIGIFATLYSLTAQGLLHWTDRIK